MWKKTSEKASEKTSEKHIPTLNDTQIKILECLAKDAHLSTVKLAETIVWMRERSLKLKTCWMICIREKLIWQMKSSLLMLVIT